MQRGELAALSCACSLPFVCGTHSLPPPTGSFVLRSRSHCAVLLVAACACMRACMQSLRPPRPGVLSHASSHMRPGLLSCFPPGPPSSPEPHRGPSAAGPLFRRGLQGGGGPHAGGAAHQRGGEALRLLRCCACCAASAALPRPQHARRLLPFSTPLHPAFPPALPPPSSRRRSHNS